LLICLFSTTVIYGQSNDSQHQRDSLLKVITSTQGEEKLKTYKTLISLQYSEEEIDLKLQYINDFIREARKQQNKKYESIAYQKELSCLYNYLRDDEFKRKVNEYLPFFKKNGFYREYYGNYVSLLQLLEANEDIKRKIEKTKQMYAEAKQENCLYGITQATYLIAQIYTREKRYGEAEKYYRETIKNALKLIKEEPNQVDNYYLVSCGYDGLVNALYLQDEMNVYFSLMPVWKKHTIDFEETFGYPDPHLVYYYRFCAFAYISKRKYEEAELHCDSIELKSTSPLELGTVWAIKTEIYKKRKEYDKAIDWIDKNIDRVTEFGDLDETVLILEDKARILKEMGRAEELYLVFNRILQLNDSLRQLENNAQLDEIRTQYEVDKHITEKAHLHNYLLFALGGCILLAIALGIWIFLNRKITRKNRTLAQQIKELTLQQEVQVNEMLAKTSFVPDEGKQETIDNDLCVESQMDKLCITIRDLLLKDKIYRNSAITQELVIESLGTNRRIFSDAFEYCFKMQFKDYVNFLRLKDAVQLLEQSDLPIEEISDTVGFGTVRTFQRQFSDKYNMTPKDYRNLMKKPDSRHPEHSEGPPALSPI
jgi:AraC-like DNA-binding protein